MVVKGGDGQGRNRWDLRVVSRDQGNGGHIPVVEWVQCAAKAGWEDEVTESIGSDRAEECVLYTELIGRVFKSVAKVWKDNEWEFLKVL